MRLKLGMVVAIMVTLVGLAACEGPPVDLHGRRYFTDDEQYYGAGPSVAVLGDSLTNSVHDRLHNEVGYRSTRTASIAGEGFAGGPWTGLFGSPAPLMVLEAQDMGAASPRVAVVALGTNDAWFPPLANTDPIPPLESIYESLASTCTVGVLIAEATTANHYDVDKAIAINAKIRLEADVVVDWRLTASAKDLLADGIHLSAQGQDGFVPAVRAGIDACIAPPP